MTDWTLLAIQFVGTLVLSFLFCRKSYNQGHDEGYSAGYAVGRLDGRTEGSRFGHNP